MEQALDALLTGAGMLWKALWALIFGYIISAGIQVLVTREQMANVLGERGPTKAGLASFFGFVSSSCSFAALAASRSVLRLEEHTSELQSLMRISYAVFCLKKNKKIQMKYIIRISSVKVLNIATREIIMYIMIT